MKKIISIVLSIMIILTTGLAAATPVQAKKESEKKLTVIKHGKFLIPVNAIEKTAGAKVEYNEKDHKVTITKGDKKIEMDLDDGSAKLNKKEQTNLFKLEGKNGMVVLTNFIRLLLGLKPIDDDDWDDWEDWCDWDDDDGKDDGKNNKTLVINDTVTGSGLYQIQYSQGWESGKQTGAYNSDNHWSKTTGAEATIRFNGTGIKLYGAKAPKHGKALILLKKGNAILDASFVDYYSKERKDNTLIYDSKVLPKAEYQLVITVAGSKHDSSTGYSVTIDRAVISGSNTTTPPPPTKPDPTDPDRFYNLTINDNLTGDSVNRFQYSGAWQYKTDLGTDNDYHVSSNSESMAYIVFQGKRIRVYGIKDVNGGYVSFMIDGKNKVEVDTYSADRKLNQLLYESPLLSDESHVLTIQVEPKKNAASLAYNVMIDRAEVAVSTSDANLALNMAATASSYDDATRIPTKAIDGDRNTNWYSTYSDIQWIRVDLGLEQVVSRVRLYWDTAYALDYKIQYSKDDVNWTDAYTTTSGNGGLDEIVFSPVQARYIRLYCTERATPYGYSLKEFEVYSY